MYPMGPTAYDRSIMFSPDGRLFQVEYARTAVSRGTTALGVVYDEGVLLAVDKRMSTSLVDAESIEKIFQIDDHIGIASSGFAADVNKLVDFSRREAQRHRTIYGEAIDVSTLVKKICDLKQLYTQYAGLRPFAASFLVAGAGDKSELMDTDPGGFSTKWYATAIGAGKKTAEEIFEKEYKRTIKLEEAMELVLKAIQATREEPIDTMSIGIATISSKTKKFEKITDVEEEKYIKAFLEKYDKKAKKK